MQTTISVHWNKGCIADEHNKRKEELCKNEKHIDLYNQHGKSAYKQLFRKDLKQVYTEIFSLDMEEYNKKVKKCRRKTIESYMEEIEQDNRGKKQTKKINGKKVIDENAERQGKQLWYEVTIKIGNTERERDEKGRTLYDKNNHHIRKEYLPKKLQQDILQEYYEEFQENNPNFVLASADLHADEGFFNKKNVWEYDVDHLHLCFVPVCHGLKQGMKTQNSMNKALKEMGCNSYDMWAKREQERLEEITQRKYKEYCENNTKFYEENGNLIIYHPISDGLRQGDMDKEQYVKEQELKEQKAELNVMQADLETSKALVNKISEKKATELTEREEKQNETEKQFEIVYRQKVQQVNNFISSKKMEFAEKEKEIQEASRKIEIEKIEFEAEKEVQMQELRSKSAEIDRIKENAEKYEAECRKRLKQANTGSEKVMGAFIRANNLYNAFLLYCEDYFEMPTTKQKNYDYQYEY